MLSFKFARQDAVFQVRTACQRNSRIEETLECRECRQMRHISQLPYEIVSAIMLIAVEAGLSSALTLASINSHWRSMALQTGTLWRTLRLGAYDTVRQLEMWTYRSASVEELRGVLCLTIPELLGGREDVDHVLNQWRKSPRFQHEPDTPLALRLEGSSWISMEELSQSESFVLPGLRSLTHTGYSPISIDFDDVPLYQQLHHLEINLRTEMNWAPPLHTLVSLRLPLLFPNVSEREMMECISGSPALEELELFFHRQFRGGGPIETPYTFGSLQRLSLGGAATWADMLEAIDAPTLKYLDLLPGPSIDVGEILRRAWARGTGIPPPLVRLRINGCGVGHDGSSFCAVMLQLPLLEELVIKDCKDDINPIVLRLAGQGATHLLDSSAKLPCPRLRFVDFSLCPQLAGAPICELVQSRLATASSVTLEGAACVEGPGSTTGMPEQVLPIRTLLIDRCPNVSADLLPWLRQRVRSVSCVRDATAYGGKLTP